MQALTEAYVDSLAPNAAAIKNGWGLVRKNQFQNMHRSPDGTLLFGECKGSGKNPYITSADFSGGQPVFRCSCPSRQFPCKHSLGLLYAYINGSTFTEAPIPGDIAAKREKAAEREEKKKKQTKTPRKTNKAALEKKLKAQLEGLRLLEKQIGQLLAAGIASISPKKLSQLEDTAKQLGNHYLKEAQNELRDFSLLWGKKLSEERLYQMAYEKLILLHSLCKKGSVHLERRLEDENLTPDTASSIEEWLGHTWQLAELKELGLVRQDARLAQLSFSSIRHDARKEFIDEGIWIDLAGGGLFCTKNYRPFKALKHVKEEDSIMEMLCTNELFIYPGEGIRRVRWNEYSFQGKPDLAMVKGFARENVADVIKEVKNLLKQPLADKHPVAFVAYERVGLADGDWLLEDRQGQRLSLVEGPDEGPNNSLDLLKLLPEKYTRNGAMLVRFYSDLLTGRLGAQPLAVITEDRHIRLVG
ncbi:SWIM zinc finger family protein [Neobacillus piezotolerans]|uniref:SWIM zinc finger family protein n=1 Tax=Neobacillus piezotolerans TaxID=2259171 RepID=A0A3D8GVX1_9BACI|nr:SWIM zinc finger family protein [Neobacillus piezotolerans]RDU38311.1 SWIM zinc finger family protein [Neobacillus piezotolerans]